jgi:hypothetical protein
MPRRHDYYYYYYYSLLFIIIAESEVVDGERLALPTKDMGSVEIYPQFLKHNPNGRFIVVCGDGEYIIYTAIGNPPSPPPPFHIFEID